MAYVRISIKSMKEIERKIVISTLAPVGSQKTYNTTDQPTVHTLATHKYTYKHTLKPTQLLICVY